MFFLLSGATVIPGVSWGVAVGKQDGGEVTIYSSAGWPLVSKDQSRRQLLVSNENLHQPKLTINFRDGTMPRCSQLNLFVKNYFPLADFVNLEFVMLAYFNWNLVRPHLIFRLYVLETLTPPAKLDEFVDLLTHIIFYRLCQQRTTQHHFSFRTLSFQPTCTMVTKGTPCVET